jgi:predicted RNA methylase
VISTKTNKMNDLTKGHKADSGPVECLGQKFPSDQARLEHYLKLLAEKLKEPTFRQQAGFPKGTDEAILAMSDPPYYTVCPNPWLTDFVQQFGKPYDSSTKYVREPLAVDVSIGKTDPIYKAHAYHTKVPHLAIVPSILHYTEPNDIVLDGFAGSGMTGVAAQWCATAPAAYRLELELAWKKDNRPPPNWGARRVILSDLSPAASLIATNNAQPFDLERFSTDASRILREVEDELGWMYTTRHTDGRTVRISTVVWSEVFVCRSCLGESVFFEAAYDASTNKVRDTVVCSHCGAEASKEDMDLKTESCIDVPHKRIDRRPVRIPVLIKYSIGRMNFTKSPDEYDLELLAKVSALELPPEVPTVELPDCQMTRVGRMRTTNTRCVHHMYLPRAAHTIAALWRKANAVPDHRARGILRYWIDSQFSNLSMLNRYRPEVSFPYNPLSGVFYMPSLIAEADPFTAYQNKIKRLVAAFSIRASQSKVAITSCGSATSLPLSDQSVDYVFTDPPFGENIYYADLNLLVEAWHRVTTDPTTEAIVDRVREKEVVQYQRLMRACFAEYFRVLKPGRWMTVVFSNSKASVWNAIQVALQEVGFVVAEVSALDKVQGSFQQVNSPNVVKQDLVISSYKPDQQLEARLVAAGGTDSCVWDFVENHLRQLSIAKHRHGALEFVVERDPRRIYDRMVSWFVRHELPVPLSTDVFLEELRVRYPQRDGMVWLPEQIPTYEKARASATGAPQVELFVSDERSAIDWLAGYLRTKPCTYQDLHPEFIVQLGAGWKKHEAKPELSSLLESNFFKYDGVSEVPTQIHSYLSQNFKNLRGLEKLHPELRAAAKDRWYVPDSNKAADLERKREKALLKEFALYLGGARRLKEFRLEVLRAGFKSAWANKDYETIISVANRLPADTIHEDEKLLLWYDQALTRQDGGGV